MTAEPPPRPQGQVARDAYKRALRTYKQSLSAKEYAKITVPATLEGTYFQAPDCLCRVVFLLFVLVLLVFELVQYTPVF